MKIEWTTIEIGKNKEKVKIIGDNGAIKVIIGGPTLENKYWWHIKVEEKGEAETVEEAKLKALSAIAHIAA